MMFKAGKEYSTRGGRPVRVYAVDGDPEHPIHGAIHFNNCGWIAHQWTKRGRLSEGSDCGLSLMPRVERRKVWAILWKNGQVTTYQNLPSVYDAVSIKEIEIEFTAGEGLDK